MTLELERLQELLADREAPERFDRAGNLIPPISLWTQDFKQAVDRAMWWHCYRQRTQIAPGIVCNVAEFRGAARVRAPEPGTGPKLAIIR